MSIPDIIEQPPPSADKFTKDSASRSRRWSVIATSRDDAKRKVEARYGLSLSLGSPYRSVYGQADTTCPLQDISVQGHPEAPLGGTGQYIVDASYSSKTEDKDPVIGGPWIWRPRPSVATGPVDLDAQGKAITNSSDESIDPPLTAVQPDLIIHGEGFMKAKDEMAAYDRFDPFVATVNAQPFLNRPTGSLLCYAPELSAAGGGWIKVSIDLHYRKPKTIGGKTYEGWVDVFRDVGTKEKLQGVFGEYYEDITVRDNTNPNVRRAVSAPVPLNGSGQKQDPAKTPAYRSVMNYDYTDFNSFPGLRR